MNDNSCTGSSRVEALALFEADYKKVYDLLYGSISFMDKEDHRSLELFMVHQCLEVLLRAVLRLLTGETVKSHSLIALLRRCRRYAKPLCEIFVENNEDEYRLLLLLDEAYEKALDSKHVMQIQKHELDIVQAKARAMLDAVKLLIK